MKRTATYWSGNDYGMRIIDIEHGIEDYAVIVFIYKGKVRYDIPMKFKIEYEDGYPGIWVNYEFYKLDEFILDDM